MAIKHTFVSPKADRDDSTIVRPTDWNADHVVEPGSLDHGDLAGLGDNDHPQYTTDAEATAIADTEVAAAVAGHAAAGDPHAGYQLESEKGAANGYAPLDSGLLVPVAYLPVFGASGGSHSKGAVPDPGSSAGTSRFLREDATWVAVAGASGGTPAVALGTAGAAGSAGTFLRTDDTLGVFDATAPVTQAFSDVAAAGSAAKAARRDHVHGMPASPGGGGGWTTEVIKTSDQSNTTTTPANDSQLVTTFGAHKWYEFEVLIQYDGSSSSADMAGRLNFSPGVEILITWHGTNTTESEEWNHLNGSRSDVPAASYFPMGVNPGFPRIYWMWGRLLNNNAGASTMRWAFQLNSGSGTATTKAGSRFRTKEIV